MTGPSFRTDPFPAGANAAARRPAAGWAGLLRFTARAHRPVLLTVGALAVAFIVVLVAFKVALDRRVVELAEATGPACPQPLAVAPSGDCQNSIDSVVFQDFAGAFNWLRLASLLLAIGLGALVGAPMFARDFEQRTQILGLTQSAGRLHWWGAKVAVALLPLTVLLLAVGAVASWAFSWFPFHVVPMESASFLATAFSPAVVGVLSACIGMTAGVLWRTTVGAIVMALVLTAGVVYGGETVRPHLAQAERVLAPVIPHSGFDSQIGWYLGSGLVDAEGVVVVGWDGQCPLWDEVDPSTTLSPEEGEEIAARCFQLAGISAPFTDFIPESRYWIVRTVWSGALLLLSVLVLGVGWRSIRRRVL